MAVSLDIIEKAIESKDVKVSEEEFSETFNQVASYIERGEYEAARPLIEATFKEKVCDIRLTMYYLYLYVQSKGIMGLSETLPLLHSLMTSHWENLSPTTKRDQHAQQSLRWFLTRLIKNFEKVNHSLKNKNPTPLKSYTVGLTEEIVPTLKEEIQKFNQALSEKWENPTLGNNLQNVQKWAIDLSQSALLAEPKKEEPKAPVQNKEAPSKQPSSEKLPSKKEPTPKKTSQQKTPEPAPEQVAAPHPLLEPSQKMEQLFEKLEAFQLLAEKGDYKKAAIIAEDIDRSIENFNPIEYFPKMFVKYYSLYAKHADQIGEGLSQTHPTLLKLYETDLDEFISW